MTIAEALNRGTETFRAAGCDSPRLDALLLLAAGTGRDKPALYAHSADTLEPEEEAAYEKMLRLRLDGQPVSYILKCKEFYGLSFYVDERVLVPRPDTEVLVEAALEILHADPEVVRVHDVCTGTGCVPIAIASFAGAQRVLEISASDISPQALEVFRLNCRKILGRELPHRESDLLDSAGGPFDMITANPPYITKAETAGMMAAGWPEPALALDGGEDGLSLIRRLIRSAGRSLREKGYLLVEASDNQAGLIRSILRRLGWRDIKTLRDLGGLRRVSVGRRGV
jgi:release factor glutamine methyltransferase